MLPPIFKVVIAGTICLLLSIVLGYSIATEDYSYFIILSLFFGFIALVVTPGYAWIIAVGLLFPFSIPLPFLFGFPLIALAIAFCCMKYFFRGAVRKKEKITTKHCFTFSIFVFFAWVVFRYGINPVTPGIAIGEGDGVTGFRSYFNYGICAFLLFTMPLFINTRETAVALIRSMFFLSLVMILILTPLVFTKSLAVATTLKSFGMFITFFDNGWIRLVVLPGFGIILLLVAMLPNLLPLSLSLRTGAFCLGWIAVIMGGNRGSFIYAMAAVVLVFLLRRQWVPLISSGAGIAIMLVALRIIGEQMPSTEGVGMLRVATLVSGRAAQMTDAEQNMTWRKVRWERAWQDIKQNPVIGLGYGGLENAFVFSNSENYSEAKIDIDVAAGTIHNGFLSASRALGIPIVILFIFILAKQSFINMREAWSFTSFDPVLKDVNIFVAANLIPLFLAIYVAFDINTFLIWFYICFGIIAYRLRAIKTPALASERKRRVSPPAPLLARAS